MISLAASGWRRVAYQAARSKMVQFVKSSLSSPSHILCVRILVDAQPTASKGIRHPYFNYLFYIYESPFLDCNASSIFERTVKMIKKTFAVIRTS